MRVVRQKQHVLGVVRRGPQFGVRVIREDEWKSKGVKQSGFPKRGHRGNHALLVRPPP